MRMILIAILFFADFALFAVPNYPPTYYIPAGGQTINNLTYYQVVNQAFYVSTSGSVNLGSNTYTLTYASLPNANATWNVIFDATNLTLATKTNVNLFGETPLATYSGIKKFYINFSVVWDAGVPIKKVTYLASLDDLKNFASSVNFNSRANFNDTVKLYGKTYVAPEVPISAGSALVAKDTTGRVEWGCTPWCTTGNAGTTAGTNFIGTTDVEDLVFKYNSTEVGRLDNTSVYFGLESYSGFSGSNSVAIGKYALRSNVSADNNTALGASALYGITTGTNNVGVGYNTGSNIESGLSNIIIGSGSAVSLVTGDDNISIGHGADVATSSTTKSIGIGYGATPSSNQLAIAGIRSISIPDMSSGVNYVLTDTSGSGDFVSRPSSYGTTYTPVTGDSVVISTQSNTINPAGTIANFTIRLPGTPTSWQIITLTSTQIITALHWSTALSGDADSVESHVPTALTAGQAIKIQYNSTLNKWLNY